MKDNIIVFPAEVVGKMDFFKRTLVKYLEIHNLPKEDINAIFERMVSRSEKYLKFGQYKFVIQMPAVSSDEKNIIETSLRQTIEKNIVLFQEVLSDSMKEILDLEIELAQLKSQSS